MRINFSNLTFAIIILTSFAFNDANADFGKYDLGIYDIQSWLPDDDDDSEYGNVNFWVHNYYGDNTHTGIDYNMGGVGNSNAVVKSYGYGVLYQTGDASSACGESSHQVSIRNLLDSGEIVYFHLLHMRDIHRLVAEAEEGKTFIAKYQELGWEGNCSPLPNMPYHLHLAVKNDDSAAVFVNSANATPRSSTQIDSTKYLDSLKAHYDNNADTVHYYHPRVVVGNDNYKELLPYISIFPESASDQYTVFGYADTDLYGSLTLVRRRSQAQFNKIGIYIRRCNDNTFPNRLAYEDMSTENERWLFDQFNGGNENNLNITVPQNTTLPLSGSRNNIPANTYLFYASLRGGRVDPANGLILDDPAIGYPVLLEMIKENELIIDNDQASTQPGEDRDQTTFTTPNPIDTSVPGYYLSANLLKGRSTATAAGWTPNRRGKLKVKVYIPEGADDVEVRYKLVFDNAQKIGVSDAITHNQPGWHNLVWNYKDENNQVISTDTFFFNKNDRISLDMNATDEDWLPDVPDSSNYDIDETQKVAVDAIKFIGLDEDIILIKEGLKIDENLARKIYRNFMTESPGPIDGISVEHGAEENGKTFSRYTLGYIVLTIDWSDGSIIVSTLKYAISSLQVLLGVSTGSNLIDVNGDGKIGLEDTIHSLRVLTKLDNDTELLKEGLVSHYEFEDNANDSSGNGNDGTVREGVSYTVGVSGKAASFDGTSSYISLGHNNPIQVDQPSSYSIWVRSQDIRYTPLYLYHEGGGSSHFYLGENREIYFHTRGDEKWNRTQSTSAYQVGQWIHIVGVFTGSENKLYINGVLENSIPNNKLENRNYSGIHSGNAIAAHGGETHFFKGEIDELRIYNRVLNNGEIQSLYSIGSDSRTFHHIDNFDTLDKNFWYFCRQNNREVADDSAVTVDSGFLTLTQDMTDKGPYMYSKPIRVDRDSVITIKRKVKIHPHYSYSYQGGDIFFNGGLFIYSADNYFDASINTKLADVGYWKFEYQGNWDTFFLHDKNKTENYIPSIWDDWFEEELTYNAKNGLTTYKIYGDTVSEITQPLEKEYIKIFIHTYGWWTGHYTKMEYIDIDIK